MFVYICMCVYLHVCIHMWMCVCVCDILMDLALCLQINEKECDIFSMLSLSIRDPGISLL